MTMYSLANDLVTCELLLRRTGETFWADKLSRFPSRGQPLTPREAEEVLGLFGGMGSFNDLILSSLNGHGVRSDEESTINAQLDQLRTRIYEQARSSLEK